MIALSAELPLRSSAVWDAYSAAQIIPHRYGETGGALIAYNPARTQFVWADHAVMAIDSVQVAGQDVSNWVWRNTTDSGGHAVALVEFDQPMDAGAAITARGRGKRHPSNGVLMDSPATVVWDVLSSIAGRAIAESEFAVFAAECAEAGLTVGGTLNQTGSVRSVALAICADVGALFAPDMPGWARLWPGASTPFARELINYRHPLSARCELSGLLNDITLRYAIEDAQPRATVRLDAPASVERFGRRSLERDAPWIASGRVAVAVATRLLQQWARPVWAVSITQIERHIEVGDAVAISHGVLPVSGSHRALSREFDISADNSAITCSVPVGDAPSVRLLQQSSLSAPEQYAGVAINSSGDRRVITVTDATGRPAAGAAVTLDGEITRTADASGRVEFPASVMRPGVHVLTVQTVDGTVMEIEVVV